MVKQIIGIDKSKAGRTYATDVKGNPMFGRTPGITEKLVAGAFANVTEQLQTMTVNDKGELVDLPVEQHRKLWIVTAVFDNRQSAIAANAEESLFDLETKAYVFSQRAAIATQYKLAEKDLEAATA